MPPRQTRQSCLVCVESASAVWTGHYRYWLMGRSFWSARSQSSLHNSSDNADSVLSIYKPQEQANWLGLWVRPQASPITSECTRPIFTRFLGLVALQAWSLWNLVAIAVATSFCWLYRPSPQNIRFACHSVDGGVRKQVQVLRWTQANQLTDQ